MKDYLCNAMVLFVYLITLCCSLRLSSMVKSSKVGAAFGAGALDCWNDLIGLYLIEILKNIQ